jgi:hypothetical protein
MKMLIELLRLVLVFILFLTAVALYSGAMLPKRVRYDKPGSKENAGAPGRLAGDSVIINTRPHCGGVANLLRTSNGA